MWSLSADDIRGRGPPVDLIEVLCFLESAGDKQVPTMISLGQHMGLNSEDATFCLDPLVGKCVMPYEWAKEEIASYNGLPDLMLVPYKGTSVCQGSSAVSAIHTLEPQGHSQRHMRPILCDVEVNVRSVTVCWQRPGRRLLPRQPSNPERWPDSWRQAPLVGEGTMRHRVFRSTQ
jgi:hypothetical protein